LIGSDYKTPKQAGIAPTRLAWQTLARRHTPLHSHGLVYDSVLCNTSLSVMLLWVKNLPSLRHVTRF